MMGDKINTFVVGKLYSIRDVMVRTYRSRKTLTLTKNSQAEIIGDHHIEVPDESRRITITNTTIVGTANGIVEVKCRCSHCNVLQNVLHTTYQALIQGGVNWVASHPPSLGITCNFILLKNEIN